MKRTRSGSFVLAAAAGLLLALPAAGYCGQNAHGKQGKLEPKQFMKEAAMGGMAEVKLGKLAQDKAQSEQVKQFGQRMVRDHGEANERLHEVARLQDVSLPKSLDAKHQAVYDRLSKLSGKQFDHAYMQEMLQDHRQDVNDFQQATHFDDAPQVKQFASKTLPTLQEHLQLAQQIASHQGIRTSRR